jgi:hypothetical protein
VLDAEAAFLHFLHAGGAWCHRVRSRPSLNQRARSPITVLVSLRVHVHEYVDGYANRYVTDLPAVSATPTGVGGSRSLI